MNESSDKTLLISKGWIQAVALVMLFGFFVMGLLAYYTYTDQPPIPARVVDANGKVVFTGQDVIAGQEIFLKNGLMEYGSIFGHGAWLGPDYTADYLHRAAELTMDYYGGNSSGAARQQTITDFKTNRYDAATGVLTYSAAQADAFQKLTAYYTGLFWNAHDEIRFASQCHYRSGTDPATYRVFQLVGLGGVGVASGQKLFLHEQLAAGIARGQSRHGGRDRSGACCR